MEFRSFLNPQSAASTFWNPLLETMPRAQLEALHLRRLRALLRHAYEHSPLYRKRYAAAGIRPEDVHSLEDFASLVPTIRKADLAAAQPTKPPYGDALALREDDLLFRFQERGNGNAPVEIPLSYAGATLHGEPWAYLFWAAGLRADTLCYLPFNWDLRLGLWSAYFGVRRLGAMMLSGGGLDHQARLRQIEQRRPQAMLATLEEVQALSEAARQEGFDLAGTSLRHLFIAGADTTGSATLRDDLAATWGAQVHRVLLHDETGVVAVGFHSGEGLHAVEDCGHCLVLDAAGKPVGDGEVGELVYTSYMQLAQPIIKYHTGDLVRLNRRPSADGRTWLFFEGGVLGRTVA
ncbi:MAG: hypothetical protein HYY96_12105 [Candidatus Tectomicrobia bacterium]|nr:hypothetical protein [Candidatus Tectomicrobia bacterium]